jgi:hypothetical protein
MSTPAKEKIVSATENYTDWLQVEIKIYFKEGQKIEELSSDLIQAAVSYGASSYVQSAICTDRVVDILFPPESQHNRNCSTELQERATKVEGLYWKRLIKHPMPKQLHISTPGNEDSSKNIEKLIPLLEKLEADLGEKAAPKRT